MPEASKIEGIEDLEEPRAESLSSDKSQASSCREFFAWRNNETRDGKSIATAYNSTSVVEALDLMASTPCSIEQTHGPTKLGFYTNQRSIRWASMDVMEFHMGCVRGIQTRLFYVNFDSILSNSELVSRERPTP